jgi:hypothetical protein
MFVPLFQQNVLLFRKKIISLGSRNIYVYRKTRKKNLNAHLEKNRRGGTHSWDLTRHLKG